MRERTMTVEPEAESVETSDFTQSRKLQPIEAAAAEPDPRPAAGRVPWIRSISAYDRKLTTLVEGRVSAEKMRFRAFLSLKAAV
jgi:hypothetical protein